MPCGGRLRRAQEGIELLRADRRLDSPARAKRWCNCHRHADKRLKAPENWKPSPVSDFARHPYMLMNLGQRDEPCPLVSKASTVMYIMPKTQKVMSHETAARCFIASATPFFVSNVIINTRVVKNISEGMGLLKISGLIEKRLL